MIIKDAEIRNFGNLKNCRFSFADGLNVIYGPNEAGKSTLQVFLKSMLFGLEKTRVRSRMDEYQKYEPWEGAAEFSGSLHFETGGQLFYLERSFSQKERRDILRNERDGEELSVAQGDLSMLLGNVSKTVYENTFCIGQNAAAADVSGSREVADALSRPETLQTEGLQLSGAQAGFEAERKKIRKQLREAETEEKYLLRVRQEREGLLRDDIESVRRQVAEKEAECKRLSKALHTSQETGNFSDRQQDKVSRDGRHFDSPQQETGGTHRKKWNALMTSGVLVFLVFGLLGRSGSIPHPAARLLCILGVILVVIGTVQEMRRQRGTQDPENEDNRTAGVEQRPENAGRELFSGFAGGESGIGGSGREENMSSGEASEAGRDSFTAKIQDRLTRAQAALELLKEQEQEKVTEFYNLQEEQQDHLKTEENIRKLKKELSALELAQDTLQDLAYRRSSSRIRVLEGETASILSEITGTPPDEIRLDGQLQPAALRAGKERTPQALSQGTADQVYFAWRMAAGKYAASEEPLPFLLDEPFAFYDEERLRRTLRWLAGQREQILLFTCTRREMECLDRAGVSYRKLEMS